MAWFRPLDQQRNDIDKRLKSKRDRQKSDKSSESKTDKRGTGGWKMTLKERKEKNTEIIQNLWCICKMMKYDNYNYIDIISFHSSSTLQFCSLKASKCSSHVDRIPHFQMMKTSFSRVWNSHVSYISYIYLIHWHLSVIYLIMTTATYFRISDPSVFGDERFP